MGRKFEFGPPHFSFPPSHLLNLLALPLPSSPGQSLTARLVESQYSFRVCVCVCVCMCVYVGERGGERERDCVHACRRRDERERRPALVRRCSPIESSSNPARLRLRLRPERCVTIGWISHQSMMSSLGHVSSILAAPFLSPLSLSLSTSPPITHLVPC